MTKLETAAFLSQAFNQLSENFKTFSLNLILCIAVRVGGGEAKQLPKI